MATLPLMRQATTPLEDTIMGMTNAYQVANNGTVIPREVTGTVERVERTGHTVYGNPIMRVYLTATAVDGTDHSGIYRVSDNASIVYGIENAEYHTAPPHVRPHPRGPYLPRGALT